MSLKPTPGSGSRGPRGACLRSMAAHSARRTCAARARTGAGDSSCAARRAPGGPRPRPGAARRSASGARARRRPRGGPPRGRPRAKRPQVPRRDPEAREPSAGDRDVDVRLACRARSPPSTRGTSSPNSSSSRASVGVDARRARRARRARARPRASPSPAGAPALRRSPSGAASSWRITRSGRNSSRCSARIVWSRSTSSSLKSR